MGLAGHDGNAVDSNFGATKNALKIAFVWRRRPGSLHKIDGQNGLRKLNGCMDDRSSVVPFVVAKTETEFFAIRKSAHRYFMNDLHWHTDTFILTVPTGLATD